MARCCPKPQGTQRRRAGQGPGPEASLGDDTPFCGRRTAHSHTHKETKSPELTLGDPCLLYGPFPANARPPLARGQGSLARSPMPIIRLAGCAS